jgi:beta-glucosidase
MLGQESGHAIMDVLYGDVNPSAKLSYTIAKNASDYPATICETEDCDFTEGVYLDYRWLEQNNITARYPFGFGLSYTNFTYGSVSVSTRNGTALSAKYATGAIGLGGQEDLFDEVIQVTTSIRNSGEVDGAEVAQLYISFPEEAAQPVKVLRGFEKQSLRVGESNDVTFSVRRRDVSYWDTAAQMWAVASGDYTFHVGASSQDIRGTAQLTI